LYLGAIRTNGDEVLSQKSNRGQHPGYVKRKCPAGVGCRHESGGRAGVVLKGPRGGKSKVPKQQGGPQPPVGQRAGNLSGGGG